MLMLKKFGYGFETASLATAAGDLRDAARKLRNTTGNPLVCGMCGQRKLAMEGAVADAGAMYEQIDPSLVLECLRVLVQILDSQGYTAVCVSTGKKLRGHVARYCRARIFEKRSQSKIVPYRTFNMLHATQHDGAPRW